MSDHLSVGHSAQLLKLEPAMSPFMHSTNEPQHTVLTAMVPVVTTTAETSTSLVLPVINDNAGGGSPPSSGGDSGASSGGDIVAHIGGVHVPGETTK